MAGVCRPLSMAEHDNCAVVLRGVGGSVWVGNGTCQRVVPVLTVCWWRWITPLSWGRACSSWREEGGVAQEGTWQCRAGGVLWPYLEVVEDVMVLGDGYRVR